MNIKQKKAPVSKFSTEILCSYSLDKTLRDEPKKLDKKIWPVLYSIPKSSVKVGTLQIGI